MRRLVTALLLTAVTALPAAAAPAWPPADWQSPLGHDHPLAGKVYDVAAGALVPAEAVFARLTEARYVLAGERHDNPDHHRVQAAVLDALIDAGRAPAVVFEQIDEDRAPALARWLAEDGSNAAALGPAVQWEERGWPAWRMYEPVAVSALGAGLPLVAGNIGRDTIKGLAFQGWDALPEARRAALKVEGALPQAVAAAHRRAVVEGHCGMLPESAADPMVRVQGAKDSAMAAAMLAAGAPADGAVLIAGNGHVRADVGVPFQLERLGAEGGVIAVAALEVQPDETDPARYGALHGVDGHPPFDYVFFTPATDHDDPCEVYKDQLQRAGDRLRGHEAAGDRTE